LSEDPAILCLGEALLERVEGSAGASGLSFGGDTSNAAVAAARQGARVGFVTAVGADPGGDALLRFWKSENIDVRHVRQVQGGRTGSYHVDPDPSQRRLTYDRQGSAASRMKPEDLNEEMFRGVSWLHTSAISQAISSDAMATVRRAMELARRTGAGVSYDTNLRLALWSLDQAKAGMRQALEYTNLALPSLDDAVALVGTEDEESLLDFFLEAGAETVALRLGERGAWVATPESRYRIAAFDVEAVDSTGAGDCFDGVFLASLLKGASPDEAGRWACAAAALAVSGYGAVAPIPRAEEVVRLLG